MEVISAEHLIVLEFPIVKYVFCVYIIINVINIILVVAFVLYN